MKISVIFTTYNKPDYLRLCILSFAQQSHLPSEVIVADDGSTEETGALIHEMKNRFSNLFAIKHVWHEDVGFRRSGILNKAAREASGDYLIFTDGDCMAHRHFVRSHVENSHPSAVLGGKRIEIGRELTERLLREGSIINSFNMRLLYDAIRGRSRKVEEAIQVKNTFLRRMLHRDRITDDGIWGCNCSLYKKLFVEVNGYDEDFQYAVEDNDLGIRALNQGKTVKSVRGLAIIFHLWHEVRWNVNSEKYRHDYAILKRRIMNKEQFCRNGIIKL
jgi:glycosyltransferase involved in cell wall biosynthesis